MPDQIRRQPKWAVENVHEATGERVRVIETHQKAVADWAAQKANEGFASTGRPYRSVVVKA